MNKLETIPTDALDATTGAGKKDRIDLKSILGPEELPPLGASDADAWKFYGGKKLK